MGEQIVERTGSTRFVMVGGRHVGAAMVEQIANIVVNHKDEPPTRNAARRTLPGNQSRGRVYKALQSCIDAGLLEYVVPANGPQGSFPRLKVTTAGYEAMMLWNTPAVEARGIVAFGSVHANDDYSDPVAHVLKHLHGLDF